MTNLNAGYQFERWESVRKWMTFSADRKLSFLDEMPIPEQVRSTLSI
jgi:hypothetical protein